MLVTLARTLRLVASIEELASTNKSLRASWQERKVSILIMIKDLATVSLGEYQLYSSMFLCLY